MNFMDAVKSGKPFKRRHWATYVLPVIGDFDVLRWSEGKDFVPTRGCIFATDYELFQEKVTITEEKLAEVWNRTVAIPSCYLQKTEESATFDKFKKELGFK